MKILQKTTCYLIAFFTLILASCSTSDSDPNNTNPGLFSANAFDATVDGASVDWTESIDTDDDTVTYAIFLEGKQVTSGLTTGQTYTFSGLEPETIYEGYVEARDGRGGTSKADFFFTTKPEIQTLYLKWRNFIVDQTQVAVAYFEIPKELEASRYTVVVKEYSINTSPATIGRSYSWTNDDVLPTGNNVGSGGSGLSAYSATVFHANTNVSSAGAGSAGAAQMLTYYSALSGSAELIIKK